MKKRLISLALALVMCLGMVFGVMPTSSFADEDTNTDGSLVVEIEAEMTEASKIGEKVGINSGDPDKPDPGVSGSSYSNDK